MKGKICIDFKKFQKYFSNSFKLGLDFMLKGKSICYLGCKDSYKC